MHCLEKTKCLAPELLVAPTVLPQHCRGGRWHWSKEEEKSPSKGFVDYVQNFITQAHMSDEDDLLLKQRESKCKKNINKHLV